MTTSSHSYSLGSSRFDWSGFWSQWRRSSSRRDHHGDDHDDRDWSSCSPKTEPGVMSVSDSRAVEGHDEVFKVTLSGKVQSRLDVSLALADVTATSGSDYRPALAVSFDGGCSWSTVECRTVRVCAGIDDFLVRVATIDDTKVESTELFKLTASASGASAVGTGTIEDNDRIVPVPKVVSVSDAGTEEGGTAVFTVTLSEASSVAAAVKLTLIAGSATADDYGNGLQASFDGGKTWTAVGGDSVSVPAGNDAFLVRVATVDDAFAEPVETFSLTAATADSSATGTATITDDEIPLPAITLSDAIAFEGESLVFNLAFESTPLTAGVIRFSLANDTAVVGEDFQDAIEVSRDGGTSWNAIAPSGQLNVGAGESALMLRIQATDDAETELFESMTITATPLNLGTAVTALGEIIDNDSARIGNPQPNAAPNALLAADVLGDDASLEVPAAGGTGSGASPAANVEVVAALLLPIDDLARQATAQAAMTN